MKSYLVFTKKRLFIIFSVFVCFTLICCEVAAINDKDNNVSTNADRLLFIKELGYTVIDDEPTTKTVNIPEVFYDVYENYNALQQQAGFDLSLYKGCEATMYTYTVTPPKDYTGDCVINLIVYEDRVIGGDASSVALGGFMLPLEKVIY